MKVLFLAPYPAGESPSQRYRMEHYLSSLNENGISWDYKPFLGKKAWKIFFSKGNLLRKVLAVCGGFLRRWWLMLQVGKYDRVYIHREAAPVGPPVFEWIIAKLYRKKIIYDYDDAIWIPVASDHNRLARYVKWFSKVKTICRMAWKVSAGNEFLADYARPFCRQVLVVPTVVDTETAHNRLQDQSTGQPAIGWTGTFSTLKYLELVVPVLQRLQQKFPFTFVVIGNKDPQLPLPHYRYMNWSAETETEDLLQIHIGLMPLFDGEIEKGKCGFKAIQYMALGIPAVVSPVGVNAKIVTDRENGFVCKNEIEWEQKLSLLLQDPALRSRMGIAARKRIVESYSVTATRQLFTGLFKD